jgi:predicted lipoprotein with Yx(FWY)xxD motif
MMKRNLSKKSINFVGLLTLGALILSACQPQVIPVTGDMPEDAPLVAEPTLEVKETEVIIQVAKDPVLGDILVDGNGMTLYMFTKDEPNKVNCAGDCLAAWPPLLADGAVTAGAGVDASLLGEAALPDGSMIVTYNQMPLYYWVNDINPGDTTGQDVNKVWHVVSPAGDPIGMEAEKSEVLLQVYNHPEYGEILADGKDMILYMFTKDGPNVSNCAGACLESWPPLLAVDDFSLGEGVDDSLLGEADLPDGSKIVTYNKMPLYYWVGDAQPGDTNGQGVNEVWYVVSVDGEVVMGMLVDDEVEYEY